MKIESEVEIKWLVHLSHKLGLKLEEELESEELEKLKMVIK